MIICVAANNRAKIKNRNFLLVTIIYFFQKVEYIIFPHFSIQHFYINLHNQSFFSISFILKYDYFGWISLLLFLLKLHVFVHIKTTYNTKNNISSKPFAKKKVVYYTKQIIFLFVWCILYRIHTCYHQLCNEKKNLKIQFNRI